MNRRSITLTIDGMSCAACASRIEKAVGRIAGVDDVQVNYALRLATVSYDPQVAALEQIEAKVRQIGYGIARPQAAAPWPRAEREEKEAKRLFLWSLGLSAPLIWAMLAHLARFPHRPALLFEPWLQLAAASAVQFVIGGGFYRRAWGALRQMSPNMDVLVVLSTSAAYFYSHYLTVRSYLHPAPHPALMFDSSALIITVVLLGKWLEAKARKRTLASLRRLHELRPQTVTVIRAGAALKVGYREVMPGDTVEVRPGERIPVDGTVREGRSFVDESAVSGEPFAKEKTAGDQVAGGSFNLNGMLRIRASRTGDDATLSRMIRLMEDAQTSKAAIQRKADQFAAVFVPLTVAIAAAAFCSAAFAFGPDPIRTALERAISVLAAACPCALGLATPISVLIGTGKAAEAGIWLKEGKVLEVLPRVDAILFDKTGTLTLGRPEIVDIHAVQADKSALIRLIAAAEQYSEHPFAHAFLREAADGVLPAVKYFTAVPGYGLAAEIGGATIHVGSSAYLRRCGIAIGRGERETAMRWQAEGKSVVFAAADGRLQGVIAISDPARRSSRHTVNRLKAMRLDVCLITGDQPAAATAAARQLGIERVYAEVAPQEKIRIVRELQAKGRIVAMVGDGINDAPALAAANVGIAVGTGADIAREAADINLARSDVRGLLDALAISRRTMRNVQQNLTLSFVYNGLTIPFAFTGHLPPWAAGLAMALSSVSVVMNALRLQALKTAAAAANGTVFPVRAAEKGIRAARRAAP